MKKLLVTLLLSMMFASAVVGCSKSGGNDNKQNNEQNDEQTEEKKEEQKSNEELILGTWKADIDMTSMMQAAFEEDETMAEYMKVPEFKMVMLFEFKEDGMMTLAVDEEALNKSFDELFESLRTGLSAYFEALIAEQNLEMTVDELLQFMGTDMDALIDGMSEMCKELVNTEEMTFENKYEVKEDKLYSYDMDETLDENEYITISFSDNDTLNFVDIETAEQEEDSETFLEMIHKLERIK